MLTIPLGQEGSINRLICKAKKSKNLLCLSLSYEPVIEQEFDWIETRGAYTSKVSRSCNQRALGQANDDFELRITRIRSSFKSSGHKGTTHYTILFLS